MVIRNIKQLTIAPGGPPFNRMPVGACLQSNHFFLGDGDAVNVDFYSTVLSTMSALINCFRIWNRKL